VRQLKVVARQHQELVAERQHGGVVSEARRQAAVYPGISVTLMTAEKRPARAR
jgi:hypothetical protein